MVSEIVIKSFNSSCAKAGLFALASINSQNIAYVI